MTKVNMLRKSNLVSMPNEVLIQVRHDKLHIVVYVIATSYAIIRNYLLLW